RRISVSVATSRWRACPIVPGIPGSPISPPRASAPRGGRGKSAEALPWPRPMQLNRGHGPGHEDMGGAPEQRFAVARRLQAEKPLIPVGIMLEADVFDSVLVLPCRPFHHPGEMRFVELLTQLRDLDLIGLRKDGGGQHGDPAWSSDQRQVT